MPCSDLVQKVARLEAQNEFLVKTVTEMAAELKEIKVWVSETRGGQKWLWVTLLVMGALGAVVDRFISWVR